MKECSKADFHRIRNCFNSRNLDRKGVFSKDSSGSLVLTLRSKTLPVFPLRENLLTLVGGETIPFEECLEVVADSVSKPMWEVYAVFNPQQSKFYYDYDNLYLQSVIEGEPWQKE